MRNQFFRELWFTSKRGTTQGKKKPFKKSTLNKTPWLESNLFDKRKEPQFPQLFIEAILFSKENLGAVFFN
jgi:hypothetical protein